MCVLFLLDLNLEACGLELLVIILPPKTRANIKENRTRKRKISGSLHHYLSPWVNIYLKQVILGIHVM